MSIPATSLEQGPLLQVMGNSVPTEKIRLTRSEKAKAICCMIFSCGLSVKCASDRYFDGLVKGDAEGVQRSIQAIRSGACTFFGPDGAIIFIQDRIFYGKPVEAFHKNQDCWPLCKCAAD